MGLENNNLHVPPPGTKFACTPRDMCGVIAGSNVGTLFMDQKTQLLLFTLDERRYGLTLSSVERVVFIVDITPLPKAPATVLGVVNVGGDIVPVYDLRKRFRLVNREISLSDHLIIARTSKQRVALVADTVSSVIEVAEQKITASEKILTEMEYGKGVVKFSDGLVLIHDLDEFLTSEEARTLGEALKEKGESEMRNV